MPISQRGYDRRDTQTRDALLSQLRAELRHIPGLALTLQQASRLFNLAPEACERVMTRLVEQGELHIRSDGRFVPRSYPG